MEYRNTILTKKEREELLKFLVEEKNLNDNFTLTNDELSKINRLEKPYHKIGYALQFLYLKNKGISVIELNNKISQNIINYVALQLNCDPGFLDKYWEIKNTKRRHFKEICEILKVSKFEQSTILIKEMHKIILFNGNYLNMVKDLLYYMINAKIVPPTISVIEHLLWLANEKGEIEIYKNITAQISDREKLRDILTVEENGFSIYSRIKNITVNPSSNGIKELLRLIKELEKFGRVVDLSFLSESRQRYFYLEIQRSDKFRIDKFRKKKKKDAYLAMFIHFKRKEFIDMVIETTSFYTHTVMKRSKKKTKEHNLKKHMKLKLNSEKLIEVIENILEIKQLEELQVYQEKLLSLKEELDSQENDMEDIDFLIKSHKNFNYFNEFLECIEFDTYTKTEFTKQLKIFSKLKNKKKINIDISVFNSQWRNYIKKFKYNRKIIELAFLYSIRDYIRSGDIFVKESKKYNSFDHYLIESQKKSDIKEVQSFIKELKQLFKIPEDLNFSLEIIQNEKTKFSDKIYSYFPKISMIEILYEVNSWTNVFEDIREIDRKFQDKYKLFIATLMSNGHNIGFAKMAISSSINEALLRRTNEFYFNNETLLKMQKTLINYHHSLKIVNNWGAGEKSSSDGMRIPINSKTIYADYNSHYGNKGGAMYRHISDQYTPFYIQMLEGRDSNHVLDGLLYHGTSLEIYDHSTDTAGYTEQMFALTYLLGFNFKPRIKNVEQQQLYSFENVTINNIKFQKINEKIIIENYNEIIRLIESIRCGKVKASLILQKINSYNRNNGIAKGLKEIGRILKTQYILEYLTNGDLRKEVQKMLNKGESINSVGRLIFFGKHGRLNESALENQLERASCLNILLASLIIWNSRYLEKVYEVVKTEEWFEEIEFQKVSPLGTQHVNFLGKYIFEDIEIETGDGLRELIFKV